MLIFVSCLGHGVFTTTETNIGIKEWIIYYFHCCEKMPAEYHESIAGFGSEFKVTVQHAGEDSHLKSVVKTQGETNVD